MEHNINDSEKIDPSRLSVNYSGDTSIFTPITVVDYIIASIDFIIRKFLSIGKGILSDECFYIDPACGDGIFIKRLFEYARSSYGAEDFIKWRNSYRYNVFGIEIDPGIAKKALNALRKQSDFENIIMGDALKLPGDMNYGIRRDSPWINIFNHLNITFRYSSLKEGWPADNESKTPSSKYKSPLVLVGNPPYAISNRKTGGISPFIKKLLQDYKESLNTGDHKKPSGLRGLSDIYIAFMRISQWILEKYRGPGILGMVLNNYFLDGLIYRGVRHALLQFFDKIFIVNLFGDYKKDPNVLLRIHSDKREFPHGLNDRKEDDSLIVENNFKVDENIFNIGAGICIFIGMHDNNKKRLDNAEVYYLGIMGSKEFKFSILGELTIRITRNMSNIKAYIHRPYTSANQSGTVPNLPFVRVLFDEDLSFIPKHKELREKSEIYSKFIYLPDIFKKHGIAAQSLHDTLVTHPCRESLEDIIDFFYSGKYRDYIIIDSRNQKWVKYPGPPYVEFHDARDWNIEYGLYGNKALAMKHLQIWQRKGLDRWWVCYDPYLMTRGTAAFGILQYLFPHQGNMAIGVPRVSRNNSGKNSIFMINCIAESHFIEGGSGIGDYLFPLYIGKGPSKIKDPKEWDKPADANVINIRDDFLLMIKHALNSSDSKNENGSEKTAENIDAKSLFYYIYGILWHPGFRDEYELVLRNDFPKIPIIRNKRLFLQISSIGMKLARYHTLQFSDPQIDLWEFPENFQKSKLKELSMICKGNLNDYLIGLKPPWNRTLEELSIKKIFFDAAHRRLYINKDFFIGNISEQMWRFNIGGIPQIKSWLKARMMYGVNERKKPKYAFLRPLTLFELWEFLRILTAIRGSLEIVKLYPPFEEIIENIFIPDKQ